MDNRVPAPKPLPVNPVPTLTPEPKPIPTTAPVTTVPREGFSRWDKLKTDSLNGSLIKTQRLEESIMESFRRLGREVEVSEFDDNDLAEALSDANGFELLKPADWPDLDLFNGIVASRHGCTQKDGALLFGQHGWVCFRPKDWADRKRADENERRESQVKRVFGAVADEVGIKPSAQSFSHAEVSVQRGVASPALTNRK